MPDAIELLTTRHSYKPVDILPDGGPTSIQIERILSAAMRVPERIGVGAIRVSLGRHTTAAEIDDVLARLGTLSSA